MLLSKEQREIFIKYLDGELASEKLILEEAKKLPGIEPFIKMKSVYLTACKIIRDSLANIEEM